MRTRYDAYIDGEPLSAVSSAIYVTDIREAAPNVRRTTANFPAGDGQRVLRAVRQYLRVTVAFEIHDQSVRRRQEICSRVQEWAAGQFLAVNTRPEQRLRVEIEQQPVVTSALGWTDALSAVFSAYGVPYWEDEYATEVRTEGSAEAEAYVPGTAAQTLVGATVENTGSAPMTAVTLRAGDSQMTFSGLSIPKGSKLELVYTDGRLLTATAAGASALARRTVESADDLTVPCGKRARFSARATGGTAKTTFYVRGLYL